MINTSGKVGEMAFFICPSRSVPPAISFALPLYCCNSETASSSEEALISLNRFILQTSLQDAEKRPSAAFPSSFVVAAYLQVRLTPLDFGSLAVGHF